MVKTGACATCRLRASIRHQFLARQRRQWISYSKSDRQDGPAEEYVDSLYEKFDRSLQQPKRSTRARNDEYRGSSAGPSHNGSIARGRYSGRPLRQTFDDGSSSRAPSMPRQEESRKEPRHYGYTGPLRKPQELIENLARPRQREQLRDHNEHVESASMVYDQSPRGPNHQASRSPTTTVPEIWLYPKIADSLPKKTVDAANAFLRSRADEDLGRAWESLQDTVVYAELMRNMRWLGKDAGFGRSLFYWVMKATDAFVASLSQDVTGNSGRKLPSPAVLIRIRAAMSPGPSTIWPYMLFRLAKQVAVLRRDSRETSQMAAQQGLQELMVVWSLCMEEQLKQRPSRADLPSTRMLLTKPDADFSFMPDTTTFANSLQAHRSWNSLTDALDLLVPPLSPTSNQKEFDYPSAALITLDILRNWEGPLDSSYKKWAKLMEVAVKSANIERVPQPLARAAAESEDEQVREYFSSLIEKFGPRKATKEPDTVEDVNGTESLEGDKPSHPLLDSLRRPPPLTESSSDFDRYVMGSIRNLYRAMMYNKVNYAKDTWKTVQRRTEQDANVQHPLLLYEQFLVTFLALREQQIVVEVWQAMMKAGHRPTIKTYSIAMQGCRYIGDTTTLEAFWSNMRRAGLQPDSHAWSTRLHCLLKSKDSDAGMRALAEMSQDWIAAARRRHEHESLEAGKKKKDIPEVSSSDLAQRYQGDIGRVPRPNQVVMNAAVAAVAGRNDRELPKVLSWARSFGLEPDLTTYNALLNVFMRHGKADEALQILRRMDEKGIQADSQTWTVLLTALFEGGFLNNLEPAVQQEKILAFLSSLKENNAANIDVKGYAVVIDRLLKHHHNPAGAHAVLEHMTARKIQPTPHIYTILMTSYFEPAPGEPPNFTAIESLWNSIRQEREMKLDSQFYDRMVEGYATHHVAAGSTRPMLHFLERMQREGKKASWTALTCAVEALVERGEGYRARGIVGKARRDVEVSRATGQRYGQRRFWGRCVELGLIGGDDVPKLEGAGDRSTSRR